MGSLEPFHALPQIRKRAREEDPIVPDVYPEDGQGSVSKRTCPDLSSPEQKHLSFLEELCEFESSPEANSLESATQEDLVTEMMKSLEKVIGAIEETSLPQSMTSGSSSQALRRSSSGKADVQDLASTAISWDSDLSDVLSNGHLVDLKDRSDCSESEVDIKYLLEASDDELGIPASPVTNAEPLRNATEEVSFIDGSLSAVQSTADLCSHLLSGWLDVNFDQLGEKSMDLERDHYDLVYSDCHL